MLLTSLVSSASSGQVRMIVVVVVDDVASTFSGKGLMLVVELFMA